MGGSITARRLKMAGKTNEPRPAILWSTQVGIPFRSAQDDVRYTRQGFSIIDDGRPATQSHDSREGRADARYAALSFQRFHQRGLFPNFVRARAAVPVHVKIVAAAENVLAEKAACIGILDRLLHEVRKI